MDASSRTPNLAGKTIALVLVLFVIAVLLIGSHLTPSIATLQEARVFENTIHKDVPIKVSIKKEKEESFKNLENENWVREFELDVTNTGEKPIYYLDLILATDVRVGEQRLVFPIGYGRNELGDIISKARPDDVPIRPGETHVFKIHPGQMRSWDKEVRNHPQATRVRVELQELSFGDGTGYFGNQPYPPANKRQSSLPVFTQSA